MMPAWFQRLNARERVLLTIIATIIFVLVNLMIWRWLLGTVEQTRAELAARKAIRDQQAVFVRERKMWTTRAEWLRQHQPVLSGPGEASALLDQLRQVATKHNILIEKPALGTGEANANYQSVFATIETKSPWQPLVRFLYDVQQPESFVVFESVNLAIESGDPTQMRGRFRIARWFAPQK
jgi:type II secretory pathway component PulM